jgi:hypothetical protein
MVAGSVVVGRQRAAGAWLVAGLAVLPLLAPEFWTGFRLAFSDPVLGVLAASEQPLSVRNPSGVWAIALATTWFALAYWRRDYRLWEGALVVLCGAAALARTGNAWLDALAMVWPLARQLTIVGAGPPVRALAAALCVTVAVATLAVSRPPELPGGALDAAVASTHRGVVLADWRWAPALARRVGNEQPVLAASGLASQPTEFWLDYIRVAQGHERWAAVLNEMNVSLVVLETADQQRKAADLIRGSADWRVLYDREGALVAERIAA